MVAKSSGGALRVRHGMNLERMTPSRGWYCLETFAYGTNVLICCVVSHGVHQVTLAPTFSSAANSQGLTWRQP